MVAVLVSVCWVCAAPVPKGLATNPVMVSVDSAVISEADPLVLQVQVRNNTGEKMVIPKRLAADCETVWFHVRKPGESEYTKRDAFAWGPNCTVYFLDMDLAVDDTASCYEVLHLSAGKPIFDVEGKWKLYAEVQTKQAVLKSEPIEITVRKSDTATGASGVFLACVTYGLMAPGSLGAKQWETLRSVKFDADRSRTAAVVKRAELFAKLKEANTPAAVETELKSMARHCEGLNAVEAGFVRLKVVEALLEMKSRHAAAWAEQLDPTLVDYQSLVKLSHVLSHRK